MNKRFAAGTAAVLTALLLAAPASAHCGHGRRAAKAPATCPVCTVEDCTIAGRHTHDGTIYCGYDHEEGFCSGTCYALCSVEGCTVAGRHTHGGTAYCGSHHEGGFCDGSCQTAYAGGHHHGHH